MSRKIPIHPHPCRFRLHRQRDRGWGEMAFEYRWDSTSGSKADDGLGNFDLAHCALYEFTTYAGNRGTWREGFFLPPDPPFPGWRFRDPTDGRSGPVGAECFLASQGWAWDRHKLGGKFAFPNEPAAFTIQAVQTYRFHCAVCGADEILLGPHTLTRTFAPQRQENTTVWRYAFEKHGLIGWMDWSAAGYVADSAGIGFGPFTAE